MYKLLIKIALICFLLAPVLSSRSAKAAGIAPSDTDSIHFVIASLVVITPGSAVYSVFGHSAIRMQCPSKGLDYCFSFENEPTFDYYLRFFAGKANAAFVAVPTRDYLSEYKAEGRGVTQYELNLTPHEKQELWRALDNDMLEGPHRKFNLIQNNCSSMSLIKIESILQDEYISFGKMPQPLSLINGEYLKYESRLSSWAQFLFTTFAGSEADKFWSTEYRMSPEMFIPVLKNAKIKKAEDASASPLPEGEGQGGGVSSRPVLTGNSKVLLPLRNTYAEPSPVSPNITFGALLLLAFAYTAYRIIRYVRVARSSEKAERSTTPPVSGKHIQSFGMSKVEALWQVFYLVLSLFLWYVTLVSGLFGVHWNWLLIPFNPFPFIVWLVARHRWWYPRVYVIYAAVLVAFVAIVPWLTCQLLPSHYMLAGAMALACLSTYFIFSLK